MTWFEKNLNLLSKRVETTKNWKNSKIDSCKKMMIDFFKKKKLFKMNNSQIIESVENFKNLLWQKRSQQSKTFQELEI